MFNKFGIRKMVKGRLNSRQYQGVGWSIISDRKHRHLVKKQSYKATSIFA